MYEFKKVRENIFSLRIPYKDIFTTVYIVRTEQGTLLFDTASYKEDVDSAIIPALCELGLANSLRYVFISHNHTDHAGGLSRLLDYYPELCVITKSSTLAEKHSGYTFLLPVEGETVLDVLSVIPIPGHTRDCAALWDGRTKTLISGDSLQLFGIYGSGKWGANITFPTEYSAAIDALRRLEVEAILTAHDYHPYGIAYFGKEEIDRALAACLAPFPLIGRLIAEAPDADDEEICGMYNSKYNLPTLAAHVVREYRRSSLFPH